MINSIVRANQCDFILWLILHLKLIHSGLELLEFPIVHIGTALHFVFEELGEFGRVVPCIDHLFCQKLLLHDAEVLLGVVLLAKAATGLLHAAKIGEELVHLVGLTVVVKVIFVFDTFLFHHH